jgi:hypothetical protein
MIGWLLEGKRRPRPHWATSRLASSSAWTRYGASSSLQPIGPPIPHDGTRPKAFALIGPGATGWHRSLRVLADFRANLPDLAGITAIAASGSELGYQILDDHINETRMMRTARQRV